jgi:hypothetical protein
MYESRDYRYITPKSMKDFAVKPPCKRSLLAQGQEADPTSIRRGEEFPKEWARRQAKLKKQTQKPIEELNRATKVSAEAGASASASAPKKSMPKKPGHKPKPLAPKPSVVKLSSSKASAPKTVAHSSAPPPATSSSVATSRASTPVVLASCQCTEGFATATIDASSALASGLISSNSFKPKTKATAGRGVRPSPKSKAIVPQADEHGMVD